MEQEPKVIKVKNNTITDHGGKVMDITFHHAI